jgi:putative nucleotidyltransferase with HDIG domain
MPPRPADGHPHHGQVAAEVRLHQHAHRPAAEAGGELPGAGADPSLVPEVGGPPPRADAPFLHRSARRALERPHDVCVALNNIGKLYTDLEYWTLAEAAYGEAIAIANAIGDHNTRIALEVNVADMWLARGDAGRAEQAVETAARLCAETGDESVAAQLDKLQGIIRRDAGELREAERLFTRAVERSEDRQDLVLLAETLRERASLFRGQGRNREALQNLNRSHRIFTHLRAARELANVDRSVSRLEDDFVDLVERWGESIEAKDRYTQGHCVRVADMSCAIALATGIDGQSLFWFRIGALLHDVGKLVVPAEVLNKPGKLTDEEWTLMRSHPTAGVDMIAGIDFPWDVRPIIESHHERWDGNGYPHGLRGEGIPIHARIVAIADVYDALTTERSYKPAMTHEEAMRVMRRERAGYFDPAILDHFERVVDDAAFRASAARLAKRGDRARRAAGPR